MPVNARWLIRLCSAQIVLACGAGDTNTSIAKYWPEWHDRWLMAQAVPGFRLEGLHDELVPGRPITYEGVKVAELINRAQHTKPEDGSTQWSVRSLAAATRTLKTMVHRRLQTLSDQTHRQKSFKLSTDPVFVEMVRDIGGLYLNPPQDAVVLCVYEMAQIQALDRAKPLLPMGLVYFEDVTQVYIRHGNTTLFAALDVATGTVIAKCKARHRHQKFLCFLRWIDKKVPKELDLHQSVDNCCTHKHANLKTWLAERARFHVHYTPTFTSWLNQVERRFGLITQKAIRRGSFSSVNELITKIEQFVAANARTKVPFKWTAAADSILEKVHELCSPISGVEH